jgi:hypothetical protein
MKGKHCEWKFSMELNLQDLTRGLKALEEEDECASAAVPHSKLS